MIDSTANSKRVAKNTLYLSFRMMLVMAVGLYTSRVVLNTLGVEDYGIYNVVGSVVVLFSFLKQAMNNATYRFFTYALGEGNKEKLSKIFAMAVNAHFIIAAIVFLLAETVGLWFLNSRLVLPEGRLLASNVTYQFSMLAFCINIIQTPYNSCIIAHERMSFFAITSIWEVILKLLVVYLLVIITGDNLINYSWLLAAVSFFLYLWYRSFCHRYFEESIYHRYWDAKLLKSMLKYSGWSIVVNATDVCVAQSMVFFFNVFFGVAANAALGIANNVNTHMVHFLQSFAQAYNPQIIKSYAKGDIKYFHELLCSTSKLSYYLFLTISIPILVNIDFILKIWLGVVPDGTGLFVIMIVLYSLIDAYSQPYWNAVHATGNLRTHQILMSSIKILNIPLAYFLLKIGFDAWTALALKAGLNFICAIVRMVYLKGLIGLSLLKIVNEVIRPVVIVTVLVMPLPIYLSETMEDGWLKLFISTACFLLVMIFMSFLFGLNVQEKNLVTTTIKQRVESYCARLAH